MIQTKELNGENPNIEIVGDPIHSSIITETPHSESSPNT
jgi:hypothetical protein